MAEGTAEDLCIKMAEGTAEEDMCIKVAWATTLKLSTQVSEQTTKTRQKIVH